MNHSNNTQCHDEVELINSFNQQKKNQELDKIEKEMEKWPDWKKEAYNEMFTKSAHTTKLEINRCAKK